MICNRFYRVQIMLMCENAFLIKVTKDTNDKAKEVCKSSRFLKIKRSTKFNKDIFNRSTLKNEWIWGRRKVVRNWKKWGEGKLQLGSNV